MDKPKIRQETLDNLLAKIDEALEELDGLACQYEESRDNMIGTNLVNTERYTRIEETADTLREAHDTIGDAADNIRDIEI